MRRSFVMVLGIAAVGLSVSHGADTGATTTTKPKFDLTSHLEIVKNSFVARRDGGKIRVEGLVKNIGGITTTGATLTATWTISRWTGSKWDIIATDRITVKPNESVKVGVTRDGPGNPNFKLDVLTRLGPRHYDTKTAQCVAPNQVFVVQYRQPDWRNNRFAQANVRGELIGAAARSFAQGLADLGFETKIKYTHRHDDWFIGTYDEYVQDVSFRCVDWQERTFNTQAAAIAFKRTLPGGAESRLVPR